MTDWRQRLQTEAASLDLFALLRALERSAPDKPRIGKAETLPQEVARIEQQPFLEFPLTAVQALTLPEGEAARVEAAVLGYFGPQGALPLMLTDEVKHWYDSGDDAFMRFANLFATRFIQLFFRAWADARPIAQADRPSEDRFAAWLGTMIGIGTPAGRNRDRIPDTVKIGHASLLTGRVASAARLGQAIRTVLGVDATVKERAGLWLEFEPGDLSRLGQQGAVLGRSSYAGARVYSISDKAVVEIRAPDLDSYRSFLPGGPRFIELTDLVRFVLGDAVDIDVALALPAEMRPAAQLGCSGQLGWTAWTAPPVAAPDTYIADACFQLRAA